MNPRRTEHESQVRDFLRSTFHRKDWELSQPRGSGHETYFAQSGSLRLFVKLGAHVERAFAMSEKGLSPQLLTAGVLDDGTSILVQEYIEGHTPRRSDYRELLPKVALLLRDMHNSERVIATLPATPSQSYREAGLTAIMRLRETWDRHKPQVPYVADWVDQCLDSLTSAVQEFTGSGLVASHNDFNRSNLLLTRDGTLSALDLDMMSLDDQACDLGAVLWWYYPLELWPTFLSAYGCDDTPGLRQRMRVRMAMHCLSIALPREASFDRFDPTSFNERLTDFRTVFEAKSNPEINLD
jgi:hypothetical protein